MKWRYELAEGMSTWNIAASNWYRSGDSKFTSFGKWILVSDSITLQSKSVRGADL